MKFQYLTLTCLIFLCLHSAQAQFEVKGEFRLRPEFSYGYKTPPDSGARPAFYTSQRTRLSSKFSKDKYTFGLAVQDVRVWGDEDLYSSTGIQGKKASLDLKEAWFRYTFTPVLSLTLGRQEWKYSDQHLLAARNWNQYGMSYDAILLSYQDKLRIDMGLSWNNLKTASFLESYPDDRLRMLDFLYMSKDFGELFKLEGLYLLSGVQDPDRVEKIHLRHTLGAVFNNGKKLPPIKASGYYQAGHNGDGQRVAAWMISARTGYEFTNTHFYIGCDLISGQNTLDTVPETDTRFDLLYGARHSYFGAMDYFSSTPKNTGNAGLCDFFLSFNADLPWKLNTSVDGHYFRLQNQLAGGTTGEGVVIALDPYLGYEVDIKFQYSVKKDIRLEAGYSFFRASRTLHHIREIAYNTHNNGHWAYLMLTVKPDLFSHTEISAQ